MGDLWTSIRTMAERKSRVLVAVTCLALLLAACGDQSSQVLQSRSGDSVDETARGNADSTESLNSESEGSATSSSDQDGLEQDNSDEVGAKLPDGPATNMSRDPDRVFEADTCYETIDSTEEPELVDCDDAHDIEIYSVQELSGGDDAPFKGLEQARALCDPAFREITGVGIGLATVFDRTVLRPSEATWEEGDRAVTCLVQYPENTTKRLSEINPVRAFDLVSPYGMEKGDCFSDFQDEAKAFNLVSCEESHDVEVFVAEIQPDGSFPGDSVIEAAADELCFGQSFEDFVGHSYSDSNLFSLRSMPIEESWEQGDRTINCLLTLDEPRVGTFEDSRL